MKRFLFSHAVGNGIRGIILLAMLLMSFGYEGARVAYAAPPANDDFGSAIRINAIEYHSVIDTTEATPGAGAMNGGDDPDNIPCPEPGDPTKQLNFGFASVWYKYTPPEKQGILLNTSNSSYDTFIAVWTGTRGNLNLVACNDETFEGFSELSLEVNAGTTYYIEVAQFNDGLGTTTNIGGTLNFNAYITNTNVKVGGTFRASYFVPETVGLRRNVINLNGGPVQVSNIAQNQILVSERVLFSVKGVNTSLSETMGLPNNQLYNAYRLPWYNNKTMDTQLRISNVSASTATIRIWIGGKLMPGNPFTLAAGASAFKAYAGIDRGPVRIASNVKILASERVIYKVKGVPVSFSELTALPENKLNRVYWLPWYTNNPTMTTQLQISNVTKFTATIRISIGGKLMTGSPFTLAPGKTRRLVYPGLDRGPVRILSNVNILASERVTYKAGAVPVSFSEMLALPSSQLDTIYWLPWYTKTSAISTQLQVANTSTSPATVHVYVNGIQRAGSPFTLAVGASKRLAFPGLDKALVKIESNVKIVASARTVFIVRGKPTSYSEIMALPNKQLDSIYWMPWYNNKTMNTQLRIVLP